MDFLSAQNLKNNDSQQHYYQNINILLDTKVRIQSNKNK